jgi:hypothetical protein
MKQVNMSLNQFFEMERGNITLKDIERLNNSKFVYGEISVLISTLFLLYIIGLISVLPTQSDTKVITAFEEIVNVIKF